MKRKYITKQTSLTSRSQSPVVKNSIHEQLEKTIADRNRILPEWEKLFQPNTPDIHDQLRSTIKELKRTKQLYGMFFTNDRACQLTNKKAA